MSLIGAHQQPGALAEQGGLAASIKRHPLIAYFILAFAGTWILYLPILISQKGLGLISLPDSLALILFVLATYAGPFLAAFITTRILEGASGVRRWFARMVQWRVGLWWYLLVLFGYPLAFGVPAMLALGAPGIQAAAHNWPPFISGYLSTIVVGFFIPTLGEEAGWRGFALPQLQKGYGPLIGTLILGCLHALWHLPAYFVRGLISPSGVFDPVLFVGNSLGIIAATFVWTWLFNHTSGSILFATYIHASSNGVSAQLLRALNISAPDPWFAIKVMGVVALLLVVFTRGRLGYRDPTALS